MCILMDPTAGNAAGYRGGVINTGFEDILVFASGPCCPPSSLVLHFVTDSHMFWVFGSLFQRRCGAPLVSCCGSGNVHLFRRCGVSSASCCGSGTLRHSGTGNINWIITLPGELHHLSSPASHVQTAGITFQLSP